MKKEKQTQKQTKKDIEDKRYLEDWFDKVLEKSKSFRGSEAEKQAFDEQLWMEVFDELVKRCRKSAEVSKDLPPALIEAVDKEYNAFHEINKHLLRSALLLYAQVYYKIIEVVSGSSVGYADLLLNSYYLQVVKKIKHLLSLDEFKGFTGKFYPPEHILPSCGLGDIGWEDGIAPDTEEFFVSVQNFLIELDGNEPAEATFLMKWIRKSIEPIIKRAEEYGQKAEHYFNNLLKNIKQENAKTEPENVVETALSKTGEVQDPALEIELNFERDRKILSHAETLKDFVEKLDGVLVNWTLFRNKKDREADEEANGHMMEVFRKVEDATGHMLQVIRGEISLHRQFFLEKTGIELPVTPSDYIGVSDWMASANLALVKAATKPKNAGDTSGKAGDKKTKRGRQKKYTPEILKAMQKLFDDVVEKQKDKDVKAAWSKVAEVFNIKNAKAAEMAVRRHQKQNK